MKIVKSKEVTVTKDGFLKERFGDHFAQISVDMTMKIRLAVKDVARVQMGSVPFEIEELTKKFVAVPQGVDDRDHLFGYDNDEGYVQGAVDYDAALQEYIRKYPKQWEAVKLVISNTRGRGRHACILGGEKVFVKQGQSLQLKEIEQCQDETVPTGQGNFAKSKLIHSGKKKVKEYQLSNGKTIRCTEDHRVLTTQGWMRIHDAFAKRVPLVEPKA